MNLIFHCDANSAYLSWSAIAMLESGSSIDLRKVPAVVAGDPENRHGIILAKSIPAKQYQIKTGESLWEARQKCKDLIVVSPDYDLYLACSDAMYNILSDYSPMIERYSIDECFLDYTASKESMGAPLAAAREIKQRMEKELGFTVNIGISTNKLLAKMGSELRKPNQIHTLFPNEIQKKMWPLPVGELFMVGRATRNKLEKINIRTIGELAKAEPEHLKALLKSHGKLIWKYANGIDHSKVIPNDAVIQKGIGNSTTTPYDITNRKEASMVLLSLVERTCQRMRKMGCVCSLVSVSLKTETFFSYSHQQELSFHTDSTSEVFQFAIKLFDEMWRNIPLRHIGVRVAHLEPNRNVQLTLFSKNDPLKEEKIDAAVDQIRKKYGDRAVMRGCFTNQSIPSMQGGTNDGNYVNLGGYRS